MKKILLLFIVLIFSFSQLVSQTIFSENFDTGTTLPAGWKQYNVDGRTPRNNASINLSFMGTDAWKMFSSTALPKVLLSISLYTPQGASDDWVVTPSIAIPATGIYGLEYDVLGVNPDDLEEYEVHVSTTGNTVADFTGAPLLDAISSPEWSTKTINLSAFAGQSVYIAFRNNSNNKLAMALDNILVRELKPNDAKVMGVSVARYSQVNVNNTLSLTVKNNGANPITGLTVNWNDGTDHVSTIAANIAPAATAVINHPTAVAVATAVEKNITVTVTQVNGAVDAVPANNTGTAKFNTISAAIEKNVLIEEGTGTWCQWCPRGAVAMKYMDEKYPTRFIGIAVHNSDGWEDPMTVDAYDAGCGFAGFPSAHVDRVAKNIEVTNSSFEQEYNARKNLTVPADISGSITANGSNVAITAKATFKTVMTGANYRLAVVITEDNVTGTTPGYRQVNAYAGGGSGVMGGFESLPNPVPAAQMVYDHVGRALLGGFDGQTGSVPATIADGTVASYTFNYAVPSTSTLANMKAVILLIDQTNDEVVNAKAVSLASAGIDEAAKTIDMQVYPNPASDVVNISFIAENKDYVVTVFDLQGRVVKTQEYANLSGGAQEIQLPVNGMAPGNYMISISTEGTSYSQHMTIK